MAFEALDWLDWLFNSLGSTRFFVSKSYRAKKRAEWKYHSKIGIAIELLVISIYTIFVLVFIGMIVHFISGYIV